MVDLPQEQRNDDQYIRDFILDQRVALNAFNEDEDDEYDLEPYPENLIQRILDEEINPDMPTEDSENQVGYIFLYYFYNRTGTPRLRFDIPQSWEQWATTFVELGQPVMWETQFVGTLGDRDLVENMIRNKMIEYVNAGLVGEFRMRRNYVMGYQ